MIDSNIYLLIELTARRIRQYGQSVLKSHGIDITIEQWLVLKLISENRATNQIWIGEQLMKDKPTISKMVNHLEKKGFIIRETSATDNRQVELSVSQKGESLMNDLFPVIEAIRLKGLSKLTVDESQNIKSILNKIQININS